jgi:hypothetical protein
MDPLVQLFYFWKPYSAVHVHVAVVNSPYTRAEQHARDTGQMDTVLCLICPSYMMAFTISLEI